MSLRVLLIATLLLLCIQLSGAVPHRLPGSGRRAPRPNVLLIITDDQGWGDIHSHGNEKLDTPNLDRLASEGVRFDRFFVSPVCAPTRASLLTGRYHLRTGVSWVTRGLETMRSEEVTLAEALKESGYRTGYFGKWHNGAHYPHNPNGQGFDHFFGFCAGHWNNYFDTTLERNGKPVHTRGYIADVLTDAAISYIEQGSDGPFFCYVAYNTPHAPFQVPDRYFDKYKARGFDDRTACIYGMVENLDDNIGRLLKRLDELKLDRNTIVVFLTDNGPNGQRFNGAMRGTKGTVHEGGVRVPLFVRWQGHIPPDKTIQQISAHVDLLPTLLELCNVEKPKTLSLDGVSLVPLFNGENIRWRDRMIFTHQSRRGEVLIAPASVRTQTHRLVLTDTATELYDMVSDPGQAKNIAGEQRAIVAELRSAYEKWFKEASEKPVERMPIPVGHRGWDEVELPAPESYFTGNVRFKGGNGWANDWLVNWRSIDDSIYWDLDVVRPGTFEITLKYACPERDLGSRICVQALEQKLEATVSRAHDPEIIPGPDRVPRGEVHEKEWASMKVGNLRLERGRMRLILRALSVPGNQVMELKAVQVKRLSE